MTAQVTFYVGTLFGFLLAVVLLPKVVSYGLRHNARARDTLRRFLDETDGYPVVFCRRCCTFLSTAPGDDGREKAE